MAGDDPMPLARIRDLHVEPVQRTVRAPGGRVAGGAMAASVVERGVAASIHRRSNGSARMNGFNRTAPHRARALRSLVATCRRLAMTLLLLAPAAVLAQHEGEYALSPGDLLKISVWKEEGLEHEVLVRPDGRISFPLAGHLQAAGRAAEAVEREIVERLKRFIPNPVVTVSVLQVAGNRIYVIGKVGQPGEFPVGRYVDVMQALALAGGLAQFAAKDDIKVLRRDGRRQIAFSFRYTEVEKGVQLEQNILLQSGDVVVVP